MDKKIIVLGVGQLNPLGGIHAPLLEPITVDEFVIRQLLDENHKVFEVLFDGEQLELTYDNFNKVNDKHIDSKKNVKEEKEATVTFESPSVPTSGIQQPNKAGKKQNTNPETK